jgi:hypothetical protein
MSYGSWGGPQKRDDRAFYEKTFRRKGLAEWDARWHGLSPAARLAFLDEVKGPVKSYTGAAQPGVGVEKFAARPLEELAAAGFVEVGPGKKEGTRRVSANADAYDFAARLRAFRKHRPIAEGTAAAVAKYIESTCHPGPFTAAVHEVLRKAGVDDHVSIEVMIGRYVLSHRWPGWVARFFKGPMAERAIEAVRKAGGPVPIVELAARVTGDTDDVRTAIDRLVGHFALIEDLDPKTWDIVVDLLPGVREAMERADRPSVRPPLEVVAAPKEVGPEGGFAVHDVRALLLEIASEPPRLRQDKAFFQKEVDRFLAALDPLPNWLAESFGWPVPDRLEEAHIWARLMKLVAESADGKATQLGLSAKGEAWLAGPLEDQYALLFDLLRARVARDAVYKPELWFFYKDVFDPYGYSDRGPSDFRFLGDNVAAMKKGGTSSYYIEAKPEDVDGLRESLYREFSTLATGTFYEAKSVVDHIAFEASNPLLLGLKQEEVIVYRDGQRVPPLEEYRREAARAMLQVFIGERLIPLGCLRAAIDEAGKLCVARTPRLDAYFGRKVAAADLAGVAGGESKVVVQPDFSVVVIGTSPAPAAALAPFCERSTRGSGQGAMVLKLTRESVVKAVANGLKPEEIVARLEQYASNDVPANVLREVKGWSGWVRRVEFATMAVLRCPDAETADRVMAALKKGAERVNETIVALDGPRLATSERAKLKDQGLIVQGGAEPVVKPVKRKKARRRSW